MTEARRGRLLLGLVLAVGGCKTPDPGSDASAGDAAATASAAPAPVDRAEAILSAEQRRVAQDVTAADQKSRDPAIRRAAVRALARIGGPAARQGLLRALDDEDGEVVAWGAYGLGFWCKGQEKETVSALVARKLSLPRPAQGQAVTMGETPKPPLKAVPRIDPLSAIARAVGRCGAEESEPTLVAWLAGDRDQAAAAAFALGDLATLRQKLREETLAALLNVAAGSAAAPPVPEALFPVGRLEHVPLTVIDRIREVATLRLATAGEARLFAVRALGRAGEGAAAELGRVLSTPGSFSATERAEAARALGRLGKAGHKALAAALPSLVPSADPVALTGLVGEDLGVLLAALDVVSAAGDPAPFRRTLAELASLPPPPAPGAPLPVLRRLALVRCGAARALAGANVHDKLLLECDVAPSGGAGHRALVEVIGRGEITGARLDALRERVREGDLRAREAALELIEKHEEIEGAAALLTDALGASESGLVATAAEVIAKQPARAVDDGATVRATARKGKRRNRKKVDLESAHALPAGPAPALVAALLAALKRPSADNDPESVDSLIDAAGALAVKDARPRLEELCRSPYPSTREHAAKALALVGAEKKTCDPPAEGGYAPYELDHLARSPVTLSLDTDAGALTLTLDPSLAPVAVTRVADLARSGYYDGLVVHRVVPGFVAQLGAPQGDGYGGPPGKPALRCETSPLPFVPLSVGVALAGRDTGSSQIFVTAGRYPHLDGQYAQLGTAGGPWTSLAEGDVIRKITVLPP
jgi:cyclophilin family peptidyl-prolyl cis-trans isomerase/HEAT repeat protein